MSSFYNRQAWARNIFENLGDNKIIADDKAEILRKCAECIFLNQKFFLKANLSDIDQLILKLGNKFLNEEFGDSRTDADKKV